MIITGVFRKRIWVKVGNKEYLYDYNLIKGYRKVLAVREVHIPDFLLKYVG